MSAREDFLVLMTKLNIPSLPSCSSAHEVPGELMTGEYHNGGWINLPLNTRRCYTAGMDVETEQTNLIIFQRYGDDHETFSIGGDELDPAGRGALVLDKDGNTSFAVLEKILTGETLRFEGVYDKTNWIEISLIQNKE